MATRTAKLYQGEDMTPVLDYTDQVIWEESEFGTRAWLGEGNASTVVIRDPLGEQGNEASLPAGLTAKSLASKNLFVIQLGTDYMFRGRVGIKNYSRDSQHVERYRQVECSLHDTNWDLDHIFVHDYVRPAENDIQRVQGVIASYLSGFPRESTALNGSNFLSGSNTVSLPENTYTQTSPLGVIREVAVTANKQFFVTGDSLLGGSLFYDGWDSATYSAGIRISDRHNEINTSGTCSSGDVGIVDYGVSETTTDAVEWFLTGTGTGSRELTIDASHTNAALYACVLARHDFPTPVVTWNGAQDFGAPLISDIANGSTGTLYVYRLLSPNVGTGRLEATSNIRLGAFFLTGVDQSTPEADIAINDPVGLSSGVTVTGGDLTIDFAGWMNMNETSPDLPVPGGAQTEAFAMFNDAGGGFDDYAFGGSWGDSTPTWTSAQSRMWVAAAVAINSVGVEGADLTFPPIWNVGPSSTEDGSEQLCEVRLFWGSGTDQYVTAHSSVTHTLYGHSSETFTDDTIATEAEAQTKANSILGHRRFEDKTYNVTIGPLTDDQVLCVRHGQLIQIKARAIPDADDHFRTMRIAQCRYTTPIVGIWFAHLQLGRPWKMEPYSKGPPLSPKAAGSGETPEPLGLDGDPGADTGTFANAGHTHGHGTFGTNDLHTEYVREASSEWVDLTDSGATTLHSHTGSGGGVDVEDEGTPLATTADTLDFVGAGVTASGTGTTKTITIPGGGGSGDAVLFYPADIAPGSPDAQDEEFVGGFNVTPTFVSNSGTATSGAILTGLFDSDSGPTTNPRYNVDSDLPSHFVMQSLNAGKFIAYWPFAPATGTDWCVFGKFVLVLPANSGTSDAAVHFGVSAAAPTTASNEVANSIMAEMRTLATGVTHASVTPGARQSESGETPRVLYAGIIGRGDNSITIVTSTDGLDWRRKTRIASGTSPAGALVTNLFIYIRDLGGGSGQGPVIMTDFVRYSDSTNDLYTLMGS